MDKSTEDGPALALQLLRLCVVLAVIVARGVRDAVGDAVNTLGPAFAVIAGRGRRRVEPGGAVLEREAEADELELDLVDRLRTEVADVEQVGLAARDQFADGVDTLALEAVVGPDREVE